MVELTSNEAPFPPKLKPSATSPLAWVAPLCRVPELLPAMSASSSSPVHHPTKPAGAAAQEGWETVRVVLPVIDPMEAWMVVFPAENALAKPEELTVATVFEV